MQKGTGSHNSQVTLTGSYATTLNGLQQGSVNQTYSLTQNCLNPSGCSISVTQQ